MPVARDPLPAVSGKLGGNIQTLQRMPVQLPVSRVEGRRVAAM